MPPQSCAFLLRLPEITLRRCAEKEKGNTRYGSTISGESVLFGGTGIATMWRSWTITKEEK